MHAAVEDPLSLCPHSMKCTATGLDDYRRLPGLRALAHLVNCRWRATGWIDICRIRVEIRRLVDGALAEASCPPVAESRGIPASLPSESSFVPPGRCMGPGTM